jgi:hypothetical protein
LGHRLIRVESPATEDARLDAPDGIIPVISVALAPTFVRTVPFDVAELPI